jgi:hypothetical protein
LLSYPHVRPEAAVPGKLIPMAGKGGENAENVKCFHCAPATYSGTHTEINHQGWQPKPDTLGP